MAIPAEAALHAVAGGSAERRQAELQRVAPDGGTARGASQRFARIPRRRQSATPRPDVDDVDPLLDQPPLDGGELGHGVAGQGGQTLAEPSHVINCMWYAPRVVRVTFQSARSSARSGLSACTRRRARRSPFLRTP